MTLNEFYAAVGGDAKQVLARIPDERMVKKFARMYAADETACQLHDAIDAGRWADAFRAAHTLKGVAQNPGLHAAAAGRFRIDGSDARRQAAGGCFSSRGGGRGARRDAGSD